jgi:hypothetical protein
MRGLAHKRILLAVLASLWMMGTAPSQPLASNDYLHDCAECHGADGKGAPSEKRTLRGYVSTDLTQLSKLNGGQFPRQKVYDAIDGRNRIAAHFQGDMPRWGAHFGLEQNDKPQSEQALHAKISALVDFIESIQEK